MNTLSSGLSLSLVANWNLHPLQCGDLVGSRNPRRKRVALYEAERKRERQTEGGIKKDMNTKIISKCSYCAGREKGHCIEFRWTVHKLSCIMKDRC